MEAGVLGVGTPGKHLQKESGFSKATGPYLCGWSVEMIHAVQPISCFGELNTDD